MLGGIRLIMPQFDTGFEEAGINWEEFAETLPALINTTTEAMIAEIVDNALDQECDKIKIELYGSSWDDLAIIVYDDGKGFIDEDNMDASFELSNRPGAGGADSKIGKFNIGLKLTPLSRCEVVIAHSIGTNGKLLYRCLDKRVIKQKRNYGTLKVMEDNQLNRHIQDNIGLDEWKTAVAMTRFTRRPELQSFSMPDKRKYGNHITTFLGLIYEQFITENDIEIEMHGNFVTPKDPFWRQFTPQEINRTLELAEDHPNAYATGHKYKMECAREWGTISTPRMPITIEDNGEQHIIHITGYSIPHTSYRSTIPDAYKDSSFFSGPGGQNITRLRAKNLSGLYFYRNGRCVCFGNTGPDSNDGWYSLLSNVEPYHHITRFRVEYPDSLDDWIGLAPNKDRVNPPSDFFDKFKAAMNVVVEIQELRGVLSDAEKFFVENYDKEVRTRKCLAGLNSKFGGSHIEKECSHCNEWHYKQTICPRKPVTPSGGGGGTTPSGRGGTTPSGGGGTTPGGGGGTTPGGEDNGGDLLAREESSITPLINKVILKLVVGDETNEDKIQQARDYLSST